jgi:TRAP-type C4-dicarboxylate transport system permease small subunit
MIKTFNTGIAFLRKANRLALIILYAVIITLTFVAVFFRYVLNNSIIWSEEMTRYLFIHLVYLGSAYVITAKQKNHLSMDIFYQSMPKGIRLAVDVFIILATVIFSALVFREAIRNMVLIKNQRWSSLPLPMTLAYLALPLGSALTVLYVIERSLGRVFAGKNKDSV